MAKGWDGKVQGPDDPPKPGTLTPGTPTGPMPPAVPTVNARADAGGRAAPAGTFPVAGTRSSRFNLNITE